MEGSVVDTSTVSVTAAGATLRGELAIPLEPVAIVAFAHASPRNRAVAQTLISHGMATLLFDLLVAGEGRAQRFDIALLAGRVIGAIDWVRHTERIAMLPLGLFGASTGAAASLVAATRSEIGAVVSRSGRPDLAGIALDELRAPTLLIVGGNDVEVLELNRRALQRMTAPATLGIVPGAGHLFEEPGTLNEVSRRAADWFCKHLATARWREQHAEVKELSCGRSRSS